MCMIWRTTAENSKNTFCSPFKLHHLSAGLQLGENLLTLGAGSLNVSNHVESGLGKIVVLAVKDLLERAEGILQGNQDTLDTGEDLGDLYTLLEQFQRGLI